MLKINATTGQVIKKPNSDVHAPRDLEPVQPEQQLEESDRYFKHMKDDREFVDSRFDGEDTDEAVAEPEGESLEEELQIIDEKVDL